MNLRETSTNFYFACDIEQATQVVNFFARKKSSGRLHKREASTLFYFADRYHLRQHGRPILAERYTAKKIGPVAELVTAVVENIKFESDIYEYIKTYLQKSDIGYVKSIKTFDNKVFSQTDIESLNFAWDKFSHLTLEDMLKLAKAYPEYYLAYQENGQWFEFQMDTLDFFKNPVDPIVANKDPFTDDEEGLELMRDAYLEYLCIERLRRGKSWKHP